MGAVLDSVDHAIGRAQQERNGLQLLKISAADALLTRSAGGSECRNGEIEIRWKS